MVSCDVLLHKVTFRYCLICSDPLYMKPINDTIVKKVCTTICAALILESCELCDCPSTLRPPEDREDVADAPVDVRLG